MAERFKAHAWKVCIRAIVSWVRIPLSPPFAEMKKLSLYIFLGLLVYSLAQAESLLPKCKGKNSKWSNCYGTIKSSSGHKYVGEFLKGKFHGQGTFTHEGRKYVGQYRNHKRQGQGTYTYANGDKYVGEWKNHKYWKGTYIYSNGDQYVGEWKKGKYNTPDNLNERDGLGSYTYANGNKYVGEWKKGKKHGHGIFTYINGKIEEGVWKKDILVIPIIPK